MTGLLFELGPCHVSDGGHNTTYNEYSWNTDANIIFLDQPVDVGYSYSDDGTTVNTTPVAGIDVYAFLQLFLTHFKEYASAPFHMAGESYGGTYIPNFASFIYHKNKELGMTPSSELVRINLASLIFGNGHTDPYLQFASMPTYACEGPYPVFKDSECEALKDKVPECQRLISSCYELDSTVVCAAAWTYCIDQFWPPIFRMCLCAVASSLFAPF